MAISFRGSFINRSPLLPAGLLPLGRSEPLGGPGPRALGLDLAILRLRGGDELVEQPLRGPCDLVDRPRERLLVGAGWLGEAADLADVLQGGVSHLFLGGGRFVVEKCVDVSA